MIFLFWWWTIPRGKKRRETASLWIVHGAKFFSPGDSSITKQNTLSFNDIKTCILCNKTLHVSWFHSALYWLIIYGFTSRSRIFHLYGDVTSAGEGLQILDLCSALRAFEQGGIFIVPHLLWHGTSVFPVSSEGPPHLVASYDTRGDVEDLF
jgi:hypothetical protein